MLCSKRTNQSPNFWDFRELGSKLTKFLPILKQRIVFLQVLHHSSVSWDITPLCFFSRNFIYFQQKEPIKVQIWWNFMWAVESLKFCSLMFSFCLSHIKFPLKKYRKVVSHATGEWCKVFLKNWLVVSNMTWGIWWIFTQPLESPKISLRWTLFIQSI